MRPVFATPESYPRYVGKERGSVPAYYPKAGEVAWSAIGEIKEVPSTYGYHEQTYGAMNERQVGVGESTCSAVSWSKLGGKSPETCRHVGDSHCAMFTVDELTRVCMERASTSRECVKIMGDIATTHGFYGSEGFEGTGESLMVIDPNEGFIFHVLADPTGESAIWAAQRVPDDAVGVVANMFTIRSLNLTDSEQFLGSSNLFAVAEAYNLTSTCRSLEDCDFTRTYSDGEYAHKYYSGRRMWGALRLLAPSYTSAHLSPTYNNLKDDAPYPATVSVTVEERVSVTDFFKVHRDHYQGTEYDLARGLAAGPFGSPNRFESGDTSIQGNWERPISLFRTSDSYVVQARSWLSDNIGGVLWFGPYCAQGTVYTPFPAGMTTIPKAYTDGHQGALDKGTALWAHRAVSQLVEKHYNAMHGDVEAAFLAKESEYLGLQAEWDQKNCTTLELNQAFGDNAASIVAEWWKLFDTLLFRFADGWFNTPGNIGKTMNYPAWWLKQVGFQNGPPPVPTGVGGDRAGLLVYPQPPPKIGGSRS